MGKKVIGIIGGMGPLATADLFKKIILNTKANSDQEHLRVLIDNNTGIPDRTSAILGAGENPLKELIKSAMLLRKMGADFLIMPCNTAHYFYSGVQKSVDIPVLNMIELTFNALIKKGVKKVALLATEGTVQSGIYQKVFGDTIEIITPDKKGQQAVTDVIYKGVKAGNKDYDILEFKKVIEGLFCSGAEILVLGCTELPLAMESYNLDYPVVDPTLELAKGAIEKANGKCI